MKIKDAKQSYPTRYMEKKWIEITNSTVLPKLVKLCLILKNYAHYYICTNHFYTVKS